MEDRARQLRDAIARYERCLLDAGNDRLAEVYRAEIAAARATLCEIEGADPASRPPGEAPMHLTCLFPNLDSTAPRPFAAKLLSHCYHGEIIAASTRSSPSSSKLIRYSAILPCPTVETNAFSDRARYAFRSCRLGVPAVGADTI